MTKLYSMNAIRKLSLLHVTSPNIMLILNSIAQKTHKKIYPNQFTNTQWNYSNESHSVRMRILKGCNSRATVREIESVHSGWIQSRNHRIYTFLDRQIVGLVTRAIGGNRFAFVTHYPAFLERFFPKGETSSRALALSRLAYSNTRTTVNCP